MRFDTESIVVRPETPEDHTLVRNIHVAAFSSDAEAKLVESLRKKAEPCISLVAEVAGLVVGHIMFSPLTIKPAQSMPMMALAPVAVLPANQGVGVGTALIKAGIDACQQQQVAAVLLLGHPEYYPRFGFRPALEYGLDCEYEVPAEAFMVLELMPDVLADVSGVIYFHPAFAQLED